MDIMEQKGRIFDIQRFSLHDGDGIRTIVFLKGCSLRCRWCCNPESQEYKIQPMVVQGEEQIIGEDRTVREVMEIVERDRPYYNRSGGGMTLSGGESLCQPEFTKALFMGAKEYGFHTALESTAYSSYEVIEGILPYLDQYLMDIKHMDSSKHKEFTGVPNELIHENARRIASSGLSQLSIRIPVVPTFNDTVEEIRDIAIFAKSLKGIKRIHLLPYHRLGQDKYQGLGRTYLMDHIQPPTAEHMHRLLETAEQASGLPCQIGG
ncbi:MAG TPA: glycyl-radical enzyme activating protein [Candidatus Merdenecus merdavium]|nr:glycyl-radical enzyme activating protein [Candidatus Merdenecus merdavium]